MKNKILIIGAVIILSIIIAILYPKMQFVYSDEGKDYQKHNILTDSLSKKQIEIKNTKDKLKILELEEGDILNQLSKLETRLFNGGETIIESTPEEDKNFLLDLDEEFLESLTLEEKKIYKEISIEDYKKELAK